MRTLRLAFAGTVISALLGTAPVAVVAQEHEETATWVTGTSTIGEMREPETFIEGELVRGMASRAPSSGATPGCLRR